MQHKHRQIDDKNGILLLQVQFILDQCVVADTQRLDLPQNETIARVHNSHKKYNMIYNAGFISGFRSRGGKCIMENFKRGQIQIQGGATLY